MRLRKKQRLMLVVLALLLVGGATGLTLAALQDKVAFFVTPSDIAAGRAKAGSTFRVGGLVAEGGRLPGQAETSRCRRASALSTPQAISCSVSWLGDRS